MSALSLYLILFSFPPYSFPCTLALTVRLSAILAAVLFDGADERFSATFANADLGFGISSFICSFIRQLYINHIPCKCIPRDIKDGMYIGSKYDFIRDSLIYSSL